MISTGNDLLKFEGLTIEELSLKMLNNDLKIGFGNDSVLVKNWDKTNLKIVTEEDTLIRSEVDRLIHAMAAFSADSEEEIILRPVAINE